MSIESPTDVTPSRKRSLPVDDYGLKATPNNGHAASPCTSSVLSTPRTIDLAQGSPSPLNNVVRPPSPAPSSSNNSEQASGSTSGTATAGAPSAKRRKLTVREKEEKQLEREARERDKAEQKARKEEEKRIKDEERRKKNEEREEKKRAKELEQQQKEEEKRKKEASQPRLSTFFVKPKSAALPPDSPAVHGYTTKEIARREDLSLEPGETPMEHASASQSPKKRTVSDYDFSFLPFSIPTHTTLAPYNRYIPNESELEVLRARLDSYAQHQNEALSENSLPPTNKRKLREIVNLPPDQMFNRGSTVPPVADIIARLHGSSGNALDFTEHAPINEQQPLELLQTIPMKYLHFGEDVRPPYFGTFTRVQLRPVSRRLARNPFSRTLPEANYEYDSEAEWEEGDEGEAVDLDEEDDEESNDGDEDMDGFLDDDSDTSKAKRGVMSGDLEPVCSGLCWEDLSGASNRNFVGFKMEILLESPLTTIDPFSTAYWPAMTNAPDTSASSTRQAPITAANGLMQPPPSRAPLQSRLNGANSTITPNGLVARPNAKFSNAAHKSKRLVPDNQLEDFKRAIDGSDLTKIAIIEALKKQFPKLPKDAIVNTLTAVASRVGKSHSDKRWVLIDK